MLNDANLNPINFYQAIEAKNRQLKELINQQLNNIDFNHSEYKNRVNGLLAHDSSNQVPAVYAFMTDAGFQNISDFLELIITENRLDNTAKDILLAATNQGRPALVYAISTSSLIAISGYMRKIIQSKLDPTIKQSRLNAQYQGCPLFYSLFRPQFNAGIILFAKEILEADNDNLDHSVKEAILTARFRNETALDVGIRLGFNSLVLQVAELILNTTKLDNKAKLTLVRPLDKLQVNLLDDYQKALWKKVRDLRGKLLQDYPLFKIMSLAIFYNDEEDRNNLDEFKFFLNHFFPNGIPLAYDAFCQQYKKFKCSPAVMLSLFKTFGSFKTHALLDISAREILASAFNDINFIIDKEPDPTVYEIFYNLFSYLNQFIILETERLDPPLPLSKIIGKIDTYLQSHMQSVEDLQKIKDIKDIFAQLEKNEIFSFLLFSEPLKKLAHFVYQAYYNVFPDDSQVFNIDPNHEESKDFLWVLTKLYVACNRKQLFSTLPEEFRIAAFYSVKNHFITPFFDQLDKLIQGLPPRSKRRLNFNDHRPVKYQKIEEVSCQEITLAALLEEAPDSFILLNNFYEFYQHFASTSAEEDYEKFQIILDSKEDIGASIWKINDSINNAKMIIKNNAVGQRIKFESKINFVEDYLNRFYEPNSYEYQNFCIFLKNIKSCLSHSVKIQTELYANANKKTESDNGVNNSVPAQYQNQEKTESLDLAKVSMSLTDLILIYFEKNEGAISSIRDLIDDFGYVFEENAKREWFAGEKSRIIERFQLIKNNFIEWIGTIGLTTPSNKSAEIDDFNKKITKLAENQSQDDYSVYHDLYKNYFRHFFIELRERHNEAAKNDEVENLSTAEHSIEIIEEMPSEKLADVQPSSEATVQNAENITLNELKTLPRDNMKSPTHQILDFDQQSTIYNHLQNVVENYFYNDRKKSDDLINSVKTVKRQKDKDIAFFDIFDDSIGTIKRLLNSAISSASLPAEIAQFVNKKIEGFNNPDNDFDERYQAFFDLFNKLILPYYKKVKLSQVHTQASNGLFGASFNGIIKNDNFLLDDELKSDDEVNSPDFF